MNLRELNEQEQTRLATVAQRRAEAENLKLAYHRARDRLAYHTRVRSPESALQQYRDDEHAARIAWTRARRALVRATAGVS